MSSNLPTRILGVLGIHAALGGVYWAIIKFGFANQNALAPDLIDRLDGDPAHVAAYVDDMSKQALLAGFGGLLVAAVLACIWLVLIDRSPPYGDKSARAKRGSWAGLMIVAVLVSIAWFWIKMIGAPIAVLLAPSVPLNASGIAFVLLVLGYWLSTALFAPASTKVAVPGGSLFGG
ncbi:hypothetical protein [Sphingomonas sp. R86521]|uniref:hypothetical protein n=1 Tax=Sphingomonas sp. R86521 TaxID=3093860 RepID=UPI0036D20E16